nr:hypothetical protein [Tumebacillus avium]
MKLENTRITPPGTASMRVYVLLRATGDNGSGTFYVDHMRAVQVAPVLDNPGFERYTGTIEGIADGWSTWQDPTAVSEFSVVNAPVAEGSRAQRVSGSNLPSYGAVDVYQAYDVLANVSYTVTGKFLIEELDNAKVQLYVDYYDINGDSIKVSAVDYWQTTDGYIELKHEGFTPSNTAYMRVYAVLRGITEGSSGSFYIDDMHVERTSNDLIPKMISNKLPSGVVLPTTEQLWYEGYKAFDEDPATAWKSQNNSGNMLEYNFETGAVVTSYSVRAVSAESAPKYWSFQAYGPNGWYNLHQGSATDWQPGMVKTFSFDNRSANKNYRLYVSQANGGAYYEIAEVEMKGYYAKPEKPWGVNLAKVGDGYVILNWKPINGVQGYNIYQGTEKINNAPITSTTYTIGGLTNLTTYPYQISAVNLAGESVKSDIVQAVPYAESAIPAMTSNTTPYGSLKFSHFTPGHDGFHAFDRDPGTYWETTVDASNKAQSVEYTFPQQYLIKGVTITPVMSSSGPRVIYFARNGPSGMGTFHNLTITDWQAGVPKTIIFPVAQTAETYRIVMYPQLNDLSMKISELEFIGQPK